MEMHKKGRVLETKRARVSFLPQVEAALHKWFTTLREQPNAPPITSAMLAQKATQ